MMTGVMFVMTVMAVVSMMTVMAMLFMVLMMVLGHGFSDVKFKFEFYIPINTPVGEKSQKKILKINRGGVKSG